MTTVWTDGQANGAIGHGGIAGISQGLYETSTVQMGPLGTKLCFDDGRIYRYAHFVGAVNRGQIAAQDFSTSGDARIDTAYTADIAAGATSFTLTDAAITTADAEDVYAGGYFIPMEGPGEGYAYRIKGNGQGSASNTMTVELFDPVVTAINSEEDCAIIGPLYKNLTTSKGAGVDTIVAGVAVVNNAAGAYGWVQTWGVGAVLCDESAGTVAAGTIAQVSNDSDAVGEAQPFGGGATGSSDAHLYSTEPQIGYFLVAGVDTEHVPIFLQIQP